MWNVLIKIVPRMGIQWSDREWEREESATIMTMHKGAGDARELCESKGFHINDNADIMCPWPVPFILSYSPRFSLLQARGARALLGNTSKELQIFPRYEIDYINGSASLKKRWGLSGSIVFDARIPDEIKFSRDSLNFNREGDFFWPLY